MRRLLAASSLLIVATATGCGDDVSMQPTSEGLTFGAARVEWIAGQAASVVLRNDGGRRVGPVVIRVSPVADAAGLAQPGAVVVSDPPAIATLAAGSETTVELSLSGGELLAPGAYLSRVTAQIEGGASVGIDAAVRVSGDPTPPVAELLVTAPAAARQGEVVRLLTQARDAEGADIDGFVPAFQAVPADAGLFSADGRFVAYRTGPVRIVARAGTAADTLTITIGARERRMTFDVVGQGLERDRFTSDLWVRGDHAWTGSWGIRTRGGEPTPGNRLLAWRLGAGDPVVTDSLILDARTTNDVKISVDGTLGVVTHEGSDDGRNGLTLFDLADPASPRTITRITEGLESGVHNAWLDGDELYLVVDGIGSGLRVFDVADPSTPRLLSSYYAGESFLHDVLVRDGLAFLSHWDAGLVILDVGNGIAAGSPGVPLEVGRLRDLGGQTHNAWYWPERGIAFVGEEDFTGPGRMHVVDVSDPRAPREVATFSGSGLTPHNFWLDEEAEVLYLAWYDAGLRALDVSGELLGELDRQGRLMGRWTHPGEAPVCWSGFGTCTWAPQLQDGLLYLSDVNRGLVVLRPDEG